MNTPPLSELKIHLDFYIDNNRPCIFVTHKDEPYGKVSVNLPQFDIEPNQFFVKTYSENANWALPLLRLYPDLFEEVVGGGKSPSCLFYCPLYKVTNKFIAEEFEKTYNPRSDMYNAEPPLWDLYTRYCEV